MNPLKIKILEVLAKHKNKWLKMKSIAKELNLGTVEAINLISNILYRLRHIPYIELRSNSHAYQYRYFEEIKVHPTNILSLSKTKSDKKAIRGSNNFKFIEFLPETRGGYCELCDKHTTISFKAEKDGCMLFLCEKHGEIINKQLGGYGGAFQ